jgi:malonate transporter
MEEYRKVQIGTERRANSSCYSALTLCTGPESGAEGGLMLTIILDGLAPVFFGLFLGYFAGWTRDVKNDHVAELNALVMDFAIPAAIFTTVAQASRETLFVQLPLAAILCSSMLLIYCAVYLMARRGYGASRAEASIQACTTSLPNYAAAGLPLISALLGTEGTVAVAVAIACGAIVPSPLTLIILESASKQAGQRHFGTVLLNAFRKPIVLAPLLAVLFALSGTGLPELAIKSLTLMGQVSGGAALFLTGLILSAQKLRLSPSPGIQVISANIIHPLLAAGLAWGIGASALTSREAIVLSALPVGFFGMLFGLRYGLSSEIVGTTLIASTILSALTLAAAIYFTAGMT